MRLKLLEVFVFYGVQIEKHNTLIKQIIKINLWKREEDL